MHYNYYSIDFKRSKQDPVNKEEYELIKADYQGFWYKIEKSVDETKEALPSPNKIKWPYFFVLLIASAIIFYLGRFAFTNRSWGGYMAGGGALLGVITLLTPLRALTMGKMDSKLHIGIKTAEIKRYFDFHSLLVTHSEDYEDYLKKLS